MKVLIVFIAISMLTVSCKTKSEVRKEQEIEKLRGELRDVKTDRSTDAENVSEEFKVEIGKLNNLVEERAITQKRQLEEVKDEIKSLEQKLISLDQKLNNLMVPPANEARGDDNGGGERPEPKAKNSFENGKKLFQEGKYEEAAEMFRIVAKKGRGEDKKKAMFWIGESSFFSSDYANAALEFGDFRQAFPKDPLAPQAAYRQASCFKKLGKNKEAKLFFQELVEKYPKSSQVAKAKAELKRLR